MAKKRGYNSYTPTQRANIVRTINKKRVTSKKTMEELCLSQGIHSSLYYRWKEQMRNAPRAAKKGVIVTTPAQEDTSKKGTRLNYTDERQRQVVDFFLEEHPDKVTVILNI